MPLMEYALLAFSSLFVIVDPIATVPAFLAMTARDTVQQRLRMARVACLVMVGVLAGFALVGQSLFNLLGITLPAVQVLEQALAKMTIMPARRLESRAPAFARKGRLQVGMDADITVFDPTTVIDRSTYMDATIPSLGIPWVVVNGQVVVEDGALTPARPGVGIRAPVR